jgi:hypothetical protein
VHYYIQSRAQARLQSIIEAHKHRYEAKHLGWCSSEISATGHTFYRCPASRNNRHNQDESEALVRYQQHLSTSGIKRTPGSTSGLETRSSFMLGMEARMKPCTLPCPTESVFHVRHALKDSKSPVTEGVRRVGTHLGQQACTTTTFR